MTNLGQFGDAVADLGLGGVGETQAQMIPCRLAIDRPMGPALKATPSFSAASDSFRVSTSDGSLSHR
jgi:hypothetical protein